MDRKNIQQHNLHLEQSTANSMRQFEKVYHEHIDALHNYGMKFNANRELIEDCVQDLFADLWEKRNKLDTIVSLRSYLLGALRRKLLRKIYSDREYVYDAEEYSGFFEMHLLKNAEAEMALAEEQLVQINSAFAKLTEKQKEVIYLRFYNQLSYKEIAEVMAVQTRTVYKLAYRAIDMLKEQISPYTPALQALLYWLIC
ncbi:RNA polymerase sigma factor (sigma-70 family) [Catalinimonas alkaloidigena]|uniref:RNA polymerase sigma factor n=1 Tax=Catalinimonas alkaloidigena TaxID=1075417 RepID=UPI0024074A29|nr:sigma-70 family RNA polymerase sigma factor [Catalinimonas alkaloidigena]MDF9796607.1 RNA polymerase sigma factor (sigma-70 family) [Catalinimonas alkaloidigena]